MENSRKRIKTREFRDEVIRLYQKYGSLNGVAMRLSCSAPTVKKVLEEENVVINKIPVSYCKDCALHKYTYTTDTDYNQRMSLVE